MLFRYDWAFRDPIASLLLCFVFCFLSQVQPPSLAVLATCPCQHWQASRLQPAGFDAAIESANAKCVSANNHMMLVGLPHCSNCSLFCYHFRYGVSNVFPVDLPQTLQLRFIFSLSKYYPATSDPQGTSDSTSALLPSIPSLPIRLCARNPTHCMMHAMVPLSGGLHTRCHFAELLYERR